MTSHEETRLSRLNQLKRTIEEIIDTQTFTNEMRERLISESYMEWGTACRKVLEYFEVIENR